MPELIIGLIVGLLLALARLSNNRPLRRAALIGNVAISPLKDSSDAALLDALILMDGAITLDRVMGDHSAAGSAEDVAQRLLKRSIL